MMDYYFNSTEFEYRAIPTDLRKYFKDVYPDFNKITDFMRPFLEEVLVLLRIESVKYMPNLAIVINMIKGKEKIRIRAFNKGKNVFNDYLDEIKSYVIKTQFDGEKCFRNIKRLVYGDLDSYINLHKNIYNKEYQFKGYMTISLLENIEREQLITDVRTTVSVLLQEGYEIMPYLKALGTRFDNEGQKELSLTMKQIIGNIYNLPVAYFAKKLVPDELMYDWIDETKKIRTNEKIPFNLKRIESISILIKYNINISGSPQQPYLVKYKSKHLIIRKLSKNMLNYTFSNVGSSLDSKLCIFYYAFIND
jgi:hypothetical protein